tara:strand:- start:2204 stop:2539 length:336 start_codon:yes stop_codon:yes gene_type:complete
MDINYLKECLKRRIELKEMYPILIGRHNFFDKNQAKLNKGIELLDKKAYLTTNGKAEIYKLGKEFIQIRNEENNFHSSRIRTLYGNVIHDTETELYSVALDVFQTYGSDSN